MVRALSLGLVAALEASTHCRLQSRLVLAGTAPRIRVKKRRWWRRRRRPGPGAEHWVLWLHCICGQAKGQGILRLLLGPRQGPPPRRVCRGFLSSRFLHPGPRVTLPLLSSPTPRPSSKGLVSYFLLYTLWRLYRLTRAGSTRNKFNPSESSILFLLGPEGKQS